MGNPGGTAAAVVLLRTQAQVAYKPMHRIVEAIFFIMRARYAWNMLPDGFPSFATVYRRFARFRDDGARNSGFRIKDQVSVWLKRWNRPRPAVLA